MGDEFPNRFVSVHRKFLSDFNNPIFVSFPRTGRHWLAACIENYFKKLVLYDSYENKETDVSKFIILHTHDEELDSSQGTRGELDIKRLNVLYLYRNSVDTVFSYLQQFTYNYNIDKVKEIANKYKNHLYKWCIAEEFTTKKTLISYDKLKNNFFKEFSKVILHFGDNIDKKKVEYLNKNITKKITNCFPPKDMSFKMYEILRKEFFKNYANLVTDIIGLESKLPL